MFTHPYIGSLSSLIWVFLSFLSSFLFLLDFSVRFINSYSSISERASKVYLIEVILLILLFILGVGLIVILLAVVVSIIIKIKLITRKFICILEEYIIKMEDKPSKSSRVTRSKSKGKGFEPNPNDDLVVVDGSNSNKRKGKDKKGSKHRTKDEIAIARQKVADNLPRLPGENDKDYNMRVVSREKKLYFQQQHPGKILEWHREYNKKNSESIFEKNKKHRLEHSEEINKRVRFNRSQLPEDEKVFLRGEAKFIYQGLSDAQKSRRNDLRREKRLDSKTANSTYEDILTLPDKSSPDYPSTIRSLLERNEGKNLSSFMKFSGKSQNALGKHLLELYKKDPSIFNNKRPGDTKIDNQFIDNIVNGVNNK